MLQFSRVTDAVLVQTFLAMLVGPHVVPSNKKHGVRYGAAFNAFLDRMDGGVYAAWRRTWEKPRRNLYVALRNGLVHEYVPKVSAKLWFCFRRTLRLRRRERRSGFQDRAVLPTLLRGR